MIFGFSSNTALARVFLLAAASVILVAAGDATNSDRSISGNVNQGSGWTDAILAPISAEDARAANAALAETTPADIAAAVSDEISAPEISLPRIGAERPMALATLVVAMDQDPDAIANDSNLRCLATAVYFESRGEPLEGQLAVAQAILNRAQSGRYASSVCGVVNQPRQFSFDRSRTPAAGKDWDTAKAIALIATGDKWHDVAPGAMSFHATYVNPNWHGKTRVAQIGRHVFYR